MKAEEHIDNCEGDRCAAEPVVTLRDDRGGRSGAEHSGTLRITDDVST